LLLGIPKGLNSALTAHCGGCQPPPGVVLCKSYRLIIPPPIDQFGIYLTAYDQFFAYSTVNIFTPTYMFRVYNDNYYRDKPERRR